MHVLFGNSPHGTSTIVSVKIFAFMSVPVSIYVWRSWSCAVAAYSATWHEGKAIFGDPSRYINVILLTSRRCKFAVCLPARGQKQEQPHSDNMLPSPPPPSDLVSCPDYFSPSGMADTKNTVYIYPAYTSYVHYLSTCIYMLEHIVRFYVRPTVRHTTIIKPVALTRPTLMKV